MSESVRWIRLSTFTSTSEQIIAIHSCQALWAKNTHEALSFERLAGVGRSFPPEKWQDCFLKRDDGLWLSSLSDGRNTCIFACHGCFPVSSFGYTVTHIMRHSKNASRQIGRGLNSLISSRTPWHYTIPRYTQKLLVSAWWNPASDFQAWHRCCRGLLPSILWAIRGCRLPLGHHHWPSSSHWL